MALVSASAIAIWRRVAPWVTATEKRLSGIAAPTLSIAVLAVALYQLHRVSWANIVDLLPRSPLFWIGFAIVYSAQGVADWVIYRRLWGATVSLADLFRKAIHNDLLINYAGEASLYARARSGGRSAGDVLAAIKDVSILSAVVGNALTILVAAVAWPAWQRLHLRVPVGGWAAGLGIALLLSPPLLVLVARRAVLRLGRADLLVVSGVHLARAATVNALTLAIWHLALPQTGMTVWIALLGLKLLASRLPLLSNKELVFAGAAVAVLGAETRAAELLTLIATLTMLTHAGLGVVLALTSRRNLTRAFTAVRIGAAGVV